MTLHDRIRAVVEEHLATARSCLEALGGSDGASSDLILSAEHALGILERHAVVGIFGRGDCSACSEGRNERDGVDWPCAEIRALATRWRVEVDG